MKSILLLTTLALASTAFADPVAKSTPNGGVEYYANGYYNQGTVEHGCIIPWKFAGMVTLGYNPKRIELGDITTFVDCDIAPVPTAYVTNVPPPAPPAAPPAAAPEPTSAPAPMPVEQPKRLKE